MQAFSAKADLTAPTAERSFSGSGAYDATVQTTRRRAPLTIVKSEDDHLLARDRKTLVATTRDSRRNFAAFRWAINKHLDFVTAHNFQSKSGLGRDFDRSLEKWVAQLSTAEAFDVTGRHPMRRFLRMLEAARVVDGDVLSVKVNGGYLQAVEGDRIRDPAEKLDGERWIQGLRITSYGGVDRFAIHKRKGSGGFEFEARVAADRAIFLGYFDRFDQYRGISPLASSVNSFVSVYQGLDYALAKSKAAQLVALVIKRQASEGFYDATDPDESSARSTYKVDFTKGTQLLDMEPGDDAGFINADIPGGETKDFWQTCIAIGLKALDIPYSFYQEDFTNFFGSRAALNLYLRACRDKRADIQDFLNAWLTWRLERAVAFNEFPFPAGYVPKPELWSWIPEGFAWWNPTQEVAAAERAIALGLASRTQYRKEMNGDDIRDVFDEIAEEEAYLRQVRNPSPNPGDPRATK